MPVELVAAFQGHQAELTRQFAPGSRYETLLVGEMALAMARLDRCADLSVGENHRTPGAREETVPMADLPG